MHRLFHRGLSVSQIEKLSVTPFSQKLRKIRQSHQYNRQSDNITDMHLAVKHPCYHDCEESADDRSNKKYLKLIQMITLSVGNYQNSHYIR